MRNGEQSSPANLETGGDDGAGFHGELPIPTQGLTGFSISLTNRSGVTSQNDTLYAVEIVPDAPPEIVLAPDQPEKATLVPTDRPGLRFEVRDDFLVERVSLCVEPADALGEGESPDPNKAKRIPVEIKKPAGALAFDFRWTDPEKTVKWQEGQHILLLDRSRGQQQRHRSWRHTHRRARVERRFAQDQTRRVDRKPAPQRRFHRKPFPFAGRTPRPRRQPDPARQRTQKTMKRLLPFSAAVLFAAGPAVAQQASTERQSEAYQASVTQDGLRRDAASVRAELVSVREQMRTLLPEDVATVDRAIQQLDSLSKDDMEKVIQSLRGASKPAGLTGEAKALADALREQGTISTSLKKLAVSLDARQSMEGIAGELSALLLRQVAARNELARFGRKDPTPDRLHNHDHERWEVVNEDQRRISDDLKLVQPKIERLASALTGPAQERFAKAAGLARDGKLTALGDQAATGTAQGPFDQALNAQGGIASLLVAMEAATSDATPAERLAALAAKLKGTLEQQGSITTIIAGFHERQSVERDTKQLQQTVSDQVAVLEAEIQPLNTQAAGQLDAALAATESASKHYERMWEERPEAQQATRDAMTDLQGALQAVDKQIAALPAQTPATAQQLDAALAALQRDTAQAAAAAQRQATPGTIPVTAEQKQALQKQVDDLQQRALPVAPAAEQALSEAAKDLRQSDPASQQAAAQQLAKAQQALAQQQAALEGRTPGQLAPGAGGGAGRPGPAGARPGAAEPRFREDRRRRGERPRHGPAGSRQRPARRRPGGRTRRRAKGARRRGPGYRRGPERRGPGETRAGAGGSQGGPTSSRPGAGRHGSRPAGTGSASRVRRCRQQRK